MKEFTREEMQDALIRWLSSEWWQLDSPEQIRANAARNAREIIQDILDHREPETRTTGHPWMGAADSGIPVFPIPSDQRLESRLDALEMRVAALEACGRNDVKRTVMTQLEKFDSFEMSHGYTVAIALTWYIEQMTKEADIISAEYQRVSADPALSAAQDKTLMTTRGLKYSARAIAEAAQRAQEALDAWRELTEEAS